MAAKLLSLLLSLLLLGQGTVNQYAEEMSLGGNLFLVNRQYMITEDYVPNDLVRPNVTSTYSNIKMRAEAAAALEEMFQAVKEEAGYTLMAISGY